MPGEYKGKNGETIESKLIGGLETYIISNRGGTYETHNPQDVINLM
ncbi:MAG: hypothetical protein KJ906_00360 [Nanoarchaeota archaeon]|nr:hypothetical protein [Nanoarchaeota archaeon]